MGVVIDPRKIHSNGDTRTVAERKVMAFASYVFALGDWKRRWRYAKARNDYETMRQLDREFEMIGV